MAGYSAALRSGGRPMVLAEQDRWLRKVAAGRLRDPVVFWARLQALPTARGPVPPNLKTLLVQRLPNGSEAVRYVRRRSGLGSLGRERLVAVADWRGSRGQGDGPVGVGMGTQGSRGQPDLLPRPGDIRGALP